MVAHCLTDDGVGSKVKVQKVLRPIQMRAGHVQSTLYVRMWLLPGGQLH